MENQRLKVVDAEDTPLWKQKEGTYKNLVSTKRTWHLIRQAAPIVNWHTGIWFQQATSKYAFCTWLALHNRLTTGDRMITWSSSIDPACIFCQHGIEIRNYLFFECVFTAAVWTKLTRGLLGTHFSTNWHPFSACKQHFGLQGPISGSSCLSNLTTLALAGKE
ncbi:uncharacterized protein LOC106398196 [Brassica napus]|uniref:uncharacterized protein LOC106398196 n=1 Tax=Brassica napus TaxID=3708 RepID=UPI0006AB03F5|nr:uncharacterized protein LOC106398196 [Brassica napus]